MRVQSVESAEDGNGFMATTAGYLSQKAGVGIKYFERHVASKSNKPSMPVSDRPIDLIFIVGTCLRLILALPLQ